MDLDMATIPTEEDVQAAQRRRRASAHLRRIQQLTQRYDCLPLEAEERLIEDLWGVMGGQL